MNRNSMRTMWYVFFGVSVVGGLVLLAAGQTLIGGLLVTMGVVRIVLLVSMQRRMRSSYRARGGESGPRGGSSSPRGGQQMLRRLAGMELDVAATTIGVAPDALRRAVDEGRSIAVLAANAGVASERVVDAVVRDANAKVDRAVADGRIAPDRATLLRGRLPNWAEQLVTQTPRMLAGTGSGAA